MLPPGGGTPSPAPTERPLHEIGTVHATTPFCKKMVEAAVEGVQIELTNDVRITAFEQALRTDDFDSNQLAKHRTTIELSKRYVELRAAAVQGEGILKQFKLDAKAATDPDQRVALEKFAEALAGALYRQKKLADSLGGYIAYLDSAQPINEFDLAEMQLNHDINISNTAYKNTENWLYQQPDVPETLGQTSKRAADGVDQRVQLINKDEDDAANRIDPAFKGC
jgi:hypothetical protein